MDKLIMTIKSKWDFALFLISTFLWQPHEIYCFKSQHSLNKIRWFFLNCYIVTHWKVLRFLSWSFFLWANFSMFIERDLSKNKFSFHPTNESPVIKCVTTFNTNVTLRPSMRYSVPGVEWKKISCPCLALPSPISVAAMVVVPCRPWWTGLN